ncbi:MAG: hypothetical protein RKO68_13580 [Candidatus Accumulibacter sp.]|nr:hypothetical protein [Accumulibacter sp.]
MDESKHSFGIESYKQIRAEVAVLLARIENLFRSSLIASSAVFAWVLTQAFSVTDKAAICLKLPKEALVIAWWIPPAFIALSGFITLATHIRVMQMSGFLAKCETELGVPELSWEAYLQPKPPLFTITTVLAWLLMLAAAGYATCVGLSMSGFSYCMASK